MFAAWVAYPLLLLALAQGAGALVQLAAGRPLPAPVRLPCGVALIIAVMDLSTRTTATATLAVPAVVALGIAGLALSVVPALRAAHRERSVAPIALRPGPGAVAALVVFAVYAAPVVLSGEATWLGYHKLDDTSVWLALVDQALAHGRTISDLAPSTYSIVLSSYLTVGYPIGSFLPLGLGHSLLGQDIAWLTDPWMAFTFAMLALALYGVARRALAHLTPWLAAVVATLAVLSTLLYGYYLWGGMKEAVGALLIGAAALTAPLPLRGERRVRAVIPFLVVVWALIAALSPGGLVWIGPGGLLAIAAFALRGRVAQLRAGEAAAPAVTAPEPAAADPAPTAAAAAASGRAVRRSAATAEPPRRSGRSRTARPAARGAPPDGKRARGRPAAAAASRETALSRGRAVAATAGRRVRHLPPWQRGVAGGLLVAALGLFLLLRPGGFVQTFTVALTSGGQLGVLVKPLNPLQAAGIWPSGDFRFAPSAPAVTYVLIALVLVGAAVAFWLELRAGRWEPVLYPLFALGGAGAAVLFASPWVAGKALASASPALPFLALLSGALLARRQPFAGALLIAVIGAGILWGDALGYHDARFAPRAIFASLDDTNSVVAGQGPTLMTEYSLYGVRHFLRAGDPEDPSDVRSRADPLVSGRELPATGSVDLDALALAGTLQYPTIVLQRSPLNTRPAEPYQLVLSNRYWQVWQRPPIVTPSILTYLPVGDVTSALTPSAVPSCRSVLALTRVPGVAQLVASTTPNPVVVNVTTGAHPAAWTDRTQLSMHGTGTADIPVSLATPGRYSVWVGGSIQNPTTVSIDGHAVGTASNDNQQPGQYIQFGAITLSAGAHRITLHHAANPLAPGSGESDVVGPLLLAPDVPTPPLVTVPVSAASTLCGRSVSWIEALGA